MLRENLRETDIAGRYGGEEFGVILSNTDAQSAMTFCERLRKQVEALEVKHEDLTISITVSLGISQAGATTPGYTDWLEQADQALYASKQGGRNQTRIFNPDQ